MIAQKPLLDNSIAKQNELFNTIFQLVVSLGLLVLTFFCFKQASEHPLFPKVEPIQICTQLIDDKCTKWQELNY